MKISVPDPRTSASSCPGRPFSRRKILATGAAACAGGLLRPLAGAAAALTSPAKPLPRWRGFNLLEKFQFSGRHEPYLESDLARIAELGFNFVRLPVDYRGYIADGDWTRFHEPALRHFDQALEWAERHGIHVCLNLHRAPGHTVAQPPEPRSLWHDPEVQRIAALHWRQFAHRFHAIPSSRLSFNLFNEPTDLDPATYRGVVAQMLQAIREEDTDRLVFCDGLAWGRRPVPELLPLGVAQMNRGYQPFELTHYRAEWVAGSEGWREPVWPGLVGASGALLGPPHREKSRPLVLAGPFPAGAVLTLVAGVVSTRALVVVRGGGRELGRHEFTTGAGDGPWRSSEWDERYQTHRCVYDSRMRVELPAGVERVEVAVPDGDWIRLFGLELAWPGGGPLRVDFPDNWGVDPGTLEFVPGTAERPATLGQVRGREWLEEEYTPWVDLEKAGGQVMVGEWGCYRHTPNEVVLRWARDCLAVWKARGWGWALWNFRGPFGILDNGRQGTETRDFHGHRLDTRLLELLREG